MFLLLSWYAFIFQFNQNKSNGINLEKFYNALIAEGLTEIDRPNSTMPLHKLPLFIKPNIVFTKFYDKELDINKRDFPNANKFYSNAIKLPVWATESDFDIVKLYVEGIKKVCKNINELV